MKTSWLRALAPVGLAFAIGCGGTVTTEEDGLVDSDGTVELGLIQDPSFKGNSVKIIAKRDYEADSKYPCKSYEEQCFNFDDSGRLLGKDGYGPGQLEGLCPSANVPISLWKFDYYVYSQADCYGEVLNGPGNTNNFVCYDVKDLNDRKYPNASYDLLKPGKNSNDVICFTENAAKGWDFDVCEDKTTYEDQAYGRLRLDCGCYQDPQTYQCSCAQDLGSLQEGCSVKPENYCQVVCEKPATPETAP